MRAILSNDKIRLLIKLAAIVAFMLLFNYCFQADVTSYTRTEIDELVDDGFIDVMFIGASRTSNGYNTALIEENTGLNVFNAGTSAQQVEGSYYMLKEVCESGGGVGEVWLDLSYNMQAVEDAYEMEYATYIVADYLHNKRNKFEYLYSAFGVSGIVNGIFPVLHSVSMKPSTLIAHVTGDYKSNPYKYLVQHGAQYQGQGYEYRADVAEENTTMATGVQEIDADKPISDYSLKYIMKIIEYCKENDIKLVLIDLPATDGMLSAELNYQLFVDYVQNLADENRLTYLNFNLAKADMLTMERTDYANGNHMNYQGAEKFSLCVSKILTGELEPSFYDTYAEKLQYNSDDTVYVSGY